MDEHPTDGVIEIYYGGIFDGSIDIDIEGKKDYAQVYHAIWKLCEKMGILAQVEETMGFLDPSEVEDEEEE